MKKAIYILLAAVVTTLPSCQKWLDGTAPTGEVESKEMFTSGEGFQGVLIGAYINMSGPSLYGLNMTTGIPEVLAQHWNISSENQWYYMKSLDYDYSSVKTTLSNTWLAYYNTIVGLNSILENIDGKEILFANGNYNLVKGEALGLRAFLHFEVLRLWGPVPTSDVNMDQKAIPYVTKVTKKVSELVSASYGEVLEAIIADLDEAEELLADDPITLYTPKILNSPAVNGPVIDEFHYYRQNRFNLYAVKAAKARYYQWTGDKDEALKYAEEVIGANVYGTPIFRLATNVDTGSDRVMRVEHIFGLQSYTLPTHVLPMFGATNGVLRQPKEILANLYSLDDIRAKNYWAEVEVSGTQKPNVYLKYLDDTGKEAVNQYMPVIRLAEMYLIAAECAETDDEAMDDYLTPFCQARNSSFATGADRATIIGKEYQRDFLGEGQMFYYYKRNSVGSFTWPENKLMDIEKYMVAKPEDQINFE